MFSTSKFLSLGLRRAASHILTDSVALPATQRYQAFSAKNKTSSNQESLKPSGIEFSKKASLEAKIRNIKKEIKKTLDQLPSRPRPPMTGYQAFMKENFDDLRSRSGFNKNLVGLVKNLSKEWNNSDHSSYEAGANLRKSTYKAELVNYKAALKNEYKDVCKKHQKLRNELKALIELKKTNPPSKPLSRSMLFVRENSGFQNPNGEGLRQIYSEYRKLTDGDIEKLNDKVAKNKESYRMEMENWFRSVSCNETLSKEARILATKIFDVNMSIWTQQQQKGGKKLHVS